MSLATTTKRIAVFRALQLGDMLCTVPALRALRAAYPDAQITLIGLPWAREFRQRFAAYLDDFVAFPGMDGFPEQSAGTASLPEFIAAMQARRFDLVLQMHGSGVLSNPLVGRFGAARVAGFFADGMMAPDPRSFIRWDEQQNEVLRFLSLLQHLGIPARGDHLEFPLSADDQRELLAVAPTLAATGDYVCIHPGARMGSRRWPAERFADVAALLADRGLQVILTGSGQESDLTQAMRRRISGPQHEVLDLAGRTTLGSLAALIAGARLLVCNDTGVSHLAAALATPSVVVSSGSDVRRWAPLAAHRHRVLWQSTVCRPCMHADCPYPGHPCASAVTVQAVCDVALQMLNAKPQATLADADAGWDRRPVTQRAPWSVAG